MFTTVEQVKEWTGQTVIPETIRYAQTILETWVGRVEEEIDNVNDLAIMARATAFQAVYIDTTGVDVYEQIGVTSQSSADMTYRFDTLRGAPFLSRHAAEAIRRLSWMGSRSVKTGAMTPNGDSTPFAEAWRRDYV